MEQLKPMVEGEDGDKTIYTNYPHSTWDNYFSGAKVMKWLGETGFGSMMTV